ncbi:zinc finger, CCHC-type containing protein [Tanacetum coccineum]
MNPTTVMVDEGKEHAKTEDPHEDVGKLEKDGDKAVVMITLLSLAFELDVGPGVGPKEALKFSHTVDFIIELHFDRIGQSFSSSSRQKHMLVLFSIARSISIINTFVSPAPYLCHEVVDVNSDLAIAHWSSSWLNNVVGDKNMIKFEGDLEVDAGIVEEGLRPLLSIYIFNPAFYACLIDCSLCGADLSSASAVTDNFVNFFVTHWRFLISSFLYLQTSDLTNANLEGANLEGANLKRVDVVYPRDMTKESGESSKKETSIPSTPQFQCPMLKPSNYSLWVIRMQIILEANGLWEMIEPNEKTQTDNKKDKTAIAFIYQALPEEQLLQITKHKTAKAIWDALKTRHIGEERVQQARLQTLKSDFEMLHMKEDEAIDTFTAKLTTLVNKAASLGHTMEDETLVRKLLNAVPDRRRGHGGSNQSQGQESNFKKETHNNSNKLTHDKSKTMCFKCKEYGHYANRCPLKKEEQSNLIEEDL